MTRKWLTTAVRTSDMIWRADLIQSAHPRKGFGLVDFGDNSPSYQRQYDWISSICYSESRQKLTETGVSPLDPCGP
ncbi:MAG: hypothetical protein AAGJ40_21755 [Planctomycetota bacterium]